MNTLWVTRMNIRELLNAFEKAIEQFEGARTGDEQFDNRKRVQLIRTEILYRFDTIRSTAS